MIKGIILDNDGLLVDTEEFKRSVINVILERYNYTLDRKTYMGKYMGNGEIVVVESLIEEFNLPLSTVSFLEEKRNRYYELLKEERKNLLLPGVPEFMEKISKLEIPVAIATGSRKKEMELILPVIGASYINAIITQEDVIYQKPNPESYLKAAKKLGIKPSESIVLDDSFRALQEAKKHSFITVLVNKDINNVEGVDYQIKSLEEFREEWLRT